jgi:hypothetical protein
MGKRLYLDNVFIADSQSAYWVIEPKNGIIKIMVYQNDGKVMTIYKATGEVWEIEKREVEEKHEEVY